MLNKGKFDAALINCMIDGDVEDDFIALMTLKLSFASAISSATAARYVD